MKQINKTRITNWLKESPRYKDFLLQPRQLTFFVLVSLGLVIATYIWFISFGHWTIWRNTTDFYDQLASAFAHGNLALEKKVSPDLLSLTNPYDPKERKGIDYPLDFSLYKAKYYLYFGPAPALLLMIFKFLGVGIIGDYLLTFIFICGIAIFQALLIIEMRKQFFPKIPFWIIPICIVFSCLASPFAWILTEARVYEVAITSGQFFLIAGIYFNLCALKENAKLPGSFLIGGTLWAFALGSRLTQALPIGFLTFGITLLSIKSYYKTRSLSKTIYSITSLGLPLAIGVAALGWYNWARFSSVFETGFSYQLTTSEIKGYSHELFSSLYVLPNLYNYFVARPKVVNIFPFLQPIRGRGNLLFPFLELPKIYYTRATTGIIYSTPFIFFAGIPMFSIFFRNMGLSNQTNSNTDTNLLKWLSIGLMGSFLFGLIPFASYFWVEGRFAMDFSPSLTILSIVGFWLGYSFLSRWPIVRKAYVIAGLGLMITSVVVSSLLVFSFRSEIYMGWNPDLWNLFQR